MKNKTIRFSLLFFLLLSINGLTAQNPEPINGYPSDKEVAQEAERSNDRVYNRKTDKAQATRSRNHKDNINKERRQGKARSTKATCGGGKNNKTSARKAHQHKEARATKLDKTSMKNAMKNRKGHWRAHKKAKHHPIFERRANARNGNK